MWDIKEEHLHETLADAIMEHQFKAVSVISVVVNVYALFIFLICVFCGFDDP